MDKRSAVVDELSKIRGAIRLPESMTRRGFVAGAGMAAAAVAAGATAALAEEAAPAEGEGAPAKAAAGEAAPTASAGMTFAGNEGKTMGEGPWRRLAGRGASDRGRPDRRGPSTPRS